MVIQNKETRTITDLKGRKLGNLVGDCAEPKAVSAAHNNESPITGMDTRHRIGGRNNRHRLEGGDASQMAPCATCEYFESAYMEYANTTEHQKAT